MAARASGTAMLTGLISALIVIALAVALLPIAARHSGLPALLERAELLSGRKFLFGSEFSAADCCAFPFLKYALKREPADDEPFHRVLDEYQKLTDEHFKLRSWIKRVDAMARA